MRNGALGIGIFLSFELYQIWLNTHNKRLATSRRTGVPPVLPCPYFGTPVLRARFFREHSADLILMPNPVMYAEAKPEPLNNFKSRLHQASLVSGSLGKRSGVNRIWYNITLCYPQDKLNSFYKYAQISDYRRSTRTTASITG